MTTPRCQECGRPIDVHDRHVRFQLPAPVLDLPDQASTEGVWMSHDDAVTSVMMQVPNVAPFVRCLLPVPLRGGFTVTFGVWVAVAPDDLQRAFRLWWEPEYPSLVLHGFLANDLPVWGLLAAPVRAIVVDADETPVIVESADPTLQGLLTEPQDHHELLAALPTEA